jgi:predicted DsbA family dithiol-disulfide isomerase
MAIEVSPGTVAVYTDVSCMWATLSLHRFYEARRRAGLDDSIRVDLRLFLLEDLNRFPLPIRMIQSEFATVGRLAPELEFKPWQQDVDAWTVSTLLANEAVHAAKAQSPAASEELDMALRLAFFRDSRTITMLHEVLAVAEECENVDAEQLREALDDGRARGAMMADYRANHENVQGSPHYFLADGHNVHNPGVEFHFAGEPAAGFAVIDRDDPGEIDALVRRAAGAA